MATGPTATEIYQRLGVRPIINAKGTATRLSGGLMHPDVAAAIAAAGQATVDMAELHGRACDLISAATGAEAGLVTSGAAAGLLLGTAACITGLDPGAMNRLPHLRGLKNEVVMVRSQRNAYDHAVRTTGARIVEVGLPDRYAGAGVRDAEAWEIADAISDRTAAVLWVAHAAARPPLEAVVAVAHDRGVPVVVDAAAELPPASNLKAFIAAGADLVAFSGGKAIGGPQASGILCGRRRLIMAAALQMLDLDIEFEDFEPPPQLIDKTLLTGLPTHGIGRPCKVGKESIVGLLTALERFIDDDSDARRQGWWTRLDAIKGDLAACASLAAEIDDQGAVPALVLRPATIAPRDLARALAAGTPSIRVDTTDADHGRLRISPLALAPADPPVIAAALRALCDR